jgi:hypothetical protein
MGNALHFATIRWTTLGYLENVGYQFLSLRHGPPPSCGALKTAARGRPPSVEGKAGT